LRKCVIRTILINNLVLFIISYLASCIWTANIFGMIGSCRALSVSAREFVGIFIVIHCAIIHKVLFALGS